MLFMCHLINSGVALRSRRHCFPILQGRDLNLREQRTPRVAWLLPTQAPGCSACDSCFWLCVYCPVDLVLGNTVSYLAVGHFYFKNVNRVMFFRGCCFRECPLPVFLAPAEFELAGLGQLCLDIGGRLPKLPRTPTLCADLVKNSSLPPS